MIANDYQKLALQTAKPFYLHETSNGEFRNLQLITAVAALAGEAGELCNKLKKMIENGEYLDHNFRDIFREELGDVQWYIPLIAHLLDISLEDLMGQNIAKLRARYPNHMVNRTGTLKNG